MVLFGFSAEHDDVGVLALAVGANLPAQFQAGKVRHHPVRQHDGRRVLPKQIERFLPASGKQQGILALFERVLDQFARDRRIVHYQDLVGCRGFDHEYPA